MKLSELKNIIREEFASALKEKKGDSTIYHINGTLVFTKKDRNLEEILSDIRAIVGITIVKTGGERKISVADNTYETDIKLKVDPNPFIPLGGFKEDKVKELTDEIRKIGGVKVFRLKGEPELKKL
jgi:hypothetical protein